MQFERLQKSGHDICKVEFLGDQQLLDRARTQAKAKTPFTHQNDPSARKRSEEEVFNMQLLGTIADMACSHLLELYLDKYAQGLFGVERYDDIRLDDFQEPDQFDTRITGSEGRTLVEVEIRSSVCNQIPVAAMVRCWHVLGWYVTRNKPAEKVRDLYMRPIYHYNRFETEPAYSALKAEDHLLDGELDLYIVGGATPEILERGTIQRGFGLLQRGATYQVVEIKKAMGVGDLLETTLDLCKSESTGQDTKARRA